MVCSNRYDGVGKRVVRSSKVQVFLREWTFWSVENRENWSDV